VLPLPVANNVALTTLGTLSVGGVVRQRLRDRLATRFVRDLRIRTPSIRFKVRNLSGGNQQKVVLGKWLATEPKLLIFDEPTRGIDVGAKVEVYGFMNALTERGAGVLLISSELPEVLGMSDRVLVMREGRLAGELPRGAATPEAVIALASGDTGGAGEGSGRWLTRGPPGRTRRSGCSVQVAAGARPPPFCCATASCWRCWRWPPFLPGVRPSS
jgi:ABC-type sugar transport system ATPase subunit